MALDQFPDKGQEALQALFSRTQLFVAADVKELSADHARVEEAHL